MFLRQGGIKQNKLIIHSSTLMWFLLFFFPLSLACSLNFNTVCWKWPIIISIKSIILLNVSRFHLLLRLPILTFKLLYCVRFSAYSQFFPQHGQSWLAFMLQVQKQFSFTFFVCVLSFQNSVILNPISTINDLIYS